MPTASLTYRHFYSSRNQTTLKALMICGGLSLSFLVAFALLGWSSSGSGIVLLMGIAWGLAAAGVLYEWKRPVIRGCWVEEDTFRWSDPRGRQQECRVYLPQVEVFQGCWEESYDFLLRDGRRVEVPTNCVHDVKQFCDFLEANYPGIKVKRTVVEATFT